MREDVMKEYMNHWASMCEDEGESRMLYEMATVGWPIIDKVEYRLSTHGVDTEDRPIPHIHLDRADDPHRLMFKFEISLVDMLAIGEPVLVLQRDVKKHIYRTNRTECSWNGYSRLRKGVIEYLESGPEDHAPRGSRSNLESLIIFWNHESGTDPNRLAKYIKAHNIDVLDRYRVYFPFLYPPVSAKKQ